MTLDREELKNQFWYLKKSTSGICFLKYSLWSILRDKPDDLSLILRTPQWKDKTDSIKLSFDLHIYHGTHIYKCACAHAHTRPCMHIYTIFFYSFPNRCPKAVFSLKLYNFKTHHLDCNFWYLFLYRELLQWLEPFRNMVDSALVTGKGHCSLIRCLLSFSSKSVSGVLLTQIWRCRSWKYARSQKISYSNDDDDEPGNPGHFLKLRTLT